MTSNPGFDVLRNIIHTILYNIRLVLQCYDFKKNTCLYCNNLHFYPSTKINVTILRGFFVLIVFLTFRYGTTLNHIKILQAMNSPNIQFLTLYITKAPPNLI